MSFIWPPMLLSVLLVPLFVVMYLRMQQRRRRLAENFGSFGMRREATGWQLGYRRHIPPVFFLTGLILLMFALARPEAVVRLPRIEGTVILAFDVSGSMAAEDLQPTRLEAAKTAARKFVEQQPSTLLIGVVAFSDSGFAVQAPTNDQEAIFATLDRLTPQLGTSLANGIFASLNTLAAEEEESDPRLYTDLTPVPTPTPTPLPEGTYTSAVIVLLTDGENNENPDPLEAAQVAAGRGIRIHTVGLGSAAGITINVEGFTVHTRLNEEMLHQISEMTGGTYYRAEDEEALQAIYEDIAPQFVIKPEKMEVTSIFAGASILVLLIGGVFSLLWFSRLP